MKPFFSLAGLNLPGDRIISVSVTDQVGFENDRLEITLDNSGGDITLPEDETEVRPVFGYDFLPGADPYYNGVTAMPGAFWVDEVEFAGPPDRVMIYAHSIYMGGKYKSAKSRDWHDTTLGKIAQKIGKENGFRSTQVDSRLSSVKIKHRDQTEQSDFTFLAKLVEENGGALKVNDNRLMVVDRDKGPTHSVSVLRTHIIRYGGVSQKRSEYDGVKARYHDYGKGKEVVVINGDSDGDRYFDLKEQFKTEEEATAAAKSKHSALKKEGETFWFECVGDPRLKADAAVIIEGIIPNVRSEWIVDKVTHTVEAASGYTSRCDCITPEAAASSKSKKTKAAKADKLAKTGSTGTPVPANVPIPTPVPIR